jgi:hypothetical protein
MFFLFFFLSARVICLLYIFLFCKFDQVILFKQKFGVRMARVLGFILGAVRGKVSGAVFSRNSSGEIVREYVVPNDANTVAQQNRRSLFTSVSSGWNALTLVIKQAWNAYANNGFVPKGGRRTNTYSGFQAYVAYNNLLAGNQQRQLVSAFNPGTIIATFAGTSSLNDVVPSVNMSPDIVDGSGNPLGYTISDATLYADGSGSIIVQFERTSGASIPVWRVPGTAYAVGFLIYCSGMLKNNVGSIPSPERFFLGFTGFPVVSSGWSDSDTFELEFTQFSDYISGLKGWPQHGSLVRISVYAVANTGQTYKLGVIQKALLPGSV